MKILILCLSLMLSLPPARAQYSYESSQFKNQESPSLFSCNEPERKTQSTDPSSLIESYFQSSRRVDAESQRCSVFYALQINKLVKGYLEKEDEQSYLRFFRILNLKIDDAYQVDLLSEQCRQQNALPLEEVEFCSREETYSHLVISLQELWSNTYVELLTSQRFRDDLIATAGIGGVSVTSVIAAVYLSHRVRLFQHGRYGTKLLSKLFSRLFRRIGFSGVKTVGRSGAQGAGRMTIAAGGGSAGAFSYQYQKKSVTSQPQKMLPAPLALTEFGRLPGEDLLEQNEDLYKDLMTLVAGTLAFGVVPAIAMEVGFARLLHIHRLGQAGRMVVGIGKKPTIFSLGFLFAGWGFQALSQCQVDNEKKKLKKNIERYKNEINEALDQGKGYLAYQITGRLVNETSQLALMYGIPFLTEVQDQHTRLMARYHCPPLNQNFDVSDEGLQSIYFQSLRQGVEERIFESREDFRSREDNWLSQMNQNIVGGFKSLIHPAMSCESSVDSLLSEGDYHQAVYATLLSSIHFIQSLNHSELNQQVEKLTSFGRYYELHADSDQLAELWYQEGENWYEESKKVRSNLVQFFEEYVQSNINQDQSDLRWENYYSGINYLSSYSDFRTPSGEKGFNCPINLDALMYVRPQFEP